MTGLEQLRKVIEEIGPDAECSEIHGVFGDDGGKCNGRSCDDCQREALRKCAENIEIEMAGLEVKAEFFKRLDSRIAEFLGIEEASYAELESLLKKRLLPEGMEWPCYEDGEPVKFGDEVHVENERPYPSFNIVVDKISFDESGFFTLFDDGSSEVEYRNGERVKRPAPKVLDADGVEIREKRDVWWICEGEERGVHAEHLRVEIIGPNGLIECSPYNGGTWVYLEPSELYVNKPVLAADGRPLREGETVWLIDDDGRENAETEVINPRDPSGGELCVMVRVKGKFGHSWVRPRNLTHERPDSWERLEADAEAWVNPTMEERAELVLRAKKLAGVE